MKIAYSHLVSNIKENPSISKLSDSLFQLGHEHDIDGNNFDMEFTPNRGDCLSVNGLLRDLAALYTIDCNNDIYNEELNELLIDFENLSEDICPKISFIKLEVDSVPGDYIGPLGDYFSDIEANKNNFFTDISNYLSYETGQPTHCYDASKMNGKFVFNEINKNVEFETLLDKKITLSRNNAVFTLNNEVINLAGVVGGKSTSCSSDTKSVIVECAFFQPEAIIGKSVRYDIQSDASHKFERGVDPECQERVLRRFIKIISDHTTIKDISFVSYNYINNPIYKIPVDLDRINQIIGIDISHQQYFNILTKLQFSFEENLIKVPSFRHDVRTHNDLAEEVARVIGYNNIEKSEINIPKSSVIEKKNIENKLRLFLIDHGFYEVINSPFVSKDQENAIKVDNPLDSNRKYLRTNITDSLVQNLLFNEKRQKDSVKLFEISDVYLSDDSIHKIRKLSVIASGRLGLNYEDFSKKINEEYLYKLFKKIIPNENLNFNLISRESLNTKIKNEIVNLEIDLNIFTDAILEYSNKSKPPKNFNTYKLISEQPSSIKDISYLIKDYSKVEDLQDLLLNYKNDIIKDIFIFDYFINDKKEEIKIGFRFIFQSKKSTLTASEIEMVYNDILDKSLNIGGLSVPGF
jgi:phenylalanyl-tRNA synthetase beta chain